MRIFAADALHGAFDFDSRLWRTLRALVFKPGELFLVVYYRLG